MKQLFGLGQVLITWGALEALRDKDSELEGCAADLLDRHEKGDWGELDDFDKSENDSAILAGNLILSAYTANSTRIWIITEADRSSTTILLPEEY